MDRNQLLQQYTGWLHTVARNMTQSDMHDDLVQEGYIAMWRALGTYDHTKGKLDWWLKEAAKNRMKSVISGAKQTTTEERKDSTGFTQARGDETRKRIAEYIKASPSATGVEIAKALGISQATLSYQRKKMGTVVTASVMTDRVVSLNALMSASPTSGSDHAEWVPEALHYHEDVERMLVCYHAGEIYDALDCLTVAQRKYVMARFWGGMNPVELKDLFGYDPNALWKAAKPKLEKRLEYLRELVNA